jgi:hypothetical protein
LFALSFFTTTETDVLLADFHIPVGKFFILRSLIIAKKSHGPISVFCGIPAGTGMELEQHSGLIFLLRSSRSN